MVSVPEPRCPPVNTVQPPTRYGVGLVSELRSSAKVVVDVLGSVPVSNSPYGVCGCKAPCEKKKERSSVRAQKLCGGRGGRPRLPVSNSPYGVCGRKAPCKKKKEVVSELRSCVEVELDVPATPSLTVGTVSAAVN